MPRLTITEIAKREGVHKSTVSRQSRAAELVGADGLVDLDEYRALRSTSLDPSLQTTGRGARLPAANDEGTLTANRTRKMAADATMAEMALHREAGRLMETERGRIANLEMARRVRDALMQLPAAIAPDLAGLMEERVIEARLRAALAAALASLAEDLAADAPIAA